MERYTTRIQALLSTSDLTTVTIKQIRIQLEQEFKVDFSQSKDSINALILQTLASTSHTKALETPDRHATPELPPINSKNKVSEIAVKRDRVAQHDSMLALQIQNDEKYYETRNGRAKPEKKRKSDESDGRKVKKVSNFRVTLRASEALQVITGSAKVTRQDVGMLFLTACNQKVKMIWEHVKANNLADPKDGRIIVCDAALEGIFGQKRVGMFKMNALLSKHLYKAGEKNDEESDEDEDMKALSSAVVKEDDDAF
jgi:upstream activation factor subunit UAF30